MERCCAFLVLHQYLLYHGASSWPRLGHPLAVEGSPLLAVGAVVVGVWLVWYNSKP